jgi:hypothetical protein
MSRKGYTLCYAGCPMLEASKMQTEIALSSTESEYVAMLQSMREGIPIMWLLEDTGIQARAKLCKPHCMPLKTMKEQWKLQE